VTITNSRPIICAHCGGEVCGAYVQAGSSHYHPFHFVCSVCGRDILEGSYVEDDGLVYHPGCHEARLAPRCSYCDKPLCGDYREDYWGLRSCIEHEVEFPSCVFCGRMVDSRRHGGSASRGGVRCIVCRRAAIEGEREAEDLFGETLCWCSAQTLAFSSRKVFVGLCDKQRICKMLGKNPAGQHLGVTKTRLLSLWNGAFHLQSLSVFILRGLPRTLFMGVSAHELGHVWLKQLGIVGLSEQHEEGFCELLAFRRYHQLKTKEGQFFASQIAGNEDNVYGEGFRAIRSMAACVGFGGILESLRAQKRLPIIERVQ